MLAFMAGQPMHIRHQVVYLQIFIMPYLFQYLFRAAYPTDPMLWKMTYRVFICESPWQWPLQGRRTHSIPKRLRGKKKLSVHLQTESTFKEKLRTYLVPITVSVFKVDCCVEGRLRELLASHHLRELPSISQPTFTALSSAINCNRTVHFDSDSYPIRIDTHALHCKVNAPHLFEDLQLREVGSGLDIKGIGTFKFKIKDNNGMTHKIEIPNSLYVPELKRCLLSPQHWVQEAKDNYPRPKGTRMSQDDKFYYVHWGQAKYQKSIPYNPLTNVLILYTAALSCAYHAFTTTLKALEAPFFQQERVLQFPGCGLTVDEPKLVPEEFVAEENVNYWKDVSASEGANADNRMVKTANLLLPQQEEPSKVHRQGPFTFNPSPPTEEAEDVQLSAANKQAKLMQPCYRLGHFAFPKLKQLALNGKIPKKLAKVLPPKCAGCLFGAMTKLPWQGKETKADHEVFVPTKPGECVLVEQMTSTEVGFFAQLKGKLTKKRYKCATVFVDHFSRLRFVHLQLNDKSNGRQACLRAVHGKTWSQDPTLPLQQRTLPRQCLPTSMSRSKATTHLLWGQRPLPKWHCRATHPRPIKKCTEATAPRARPLAGGSPLCTGAICLAKCSLPSQQPTSAGGWHI
jgi:hypothetical protein